MNFLTADVKVKVDDSQVGPALTAMKSKTLAAVAVMEKSFKRLGDAVKRMYDRMVKYAKWAGVAIAAALALSTKAAMKQEDAMFGLAAALAVTGDYSDKVMGQFKRFAASIQEVTKYGDEEVLTLMALMKNLGVTSEKLGEATKMAIGMAAATGRDVNSMAMYIALAQQGEFTMLRRYIPALRATTDETEQLAIITEFAARGFKIAQAQAETTTGALKQMWNALGDIAEVIGAPLLKGLKETAIGIRNWAKRNEAAIAWWAERVTIEVTYVKDIFWEFVKFLFTDFKDGMTYVFETIVVLAKAVSVRVLMIINKMIIGIYEALDPGIIKKQVGNLLVASSRAVRENIHLWKNALAELEALAPPELGKGFEKVAGKRVAALEKLQKEGVTAYRMPEVAGISALDRLDEKTKDYTEKTKDKLIDLGEHWRRFFSRIEYNMGDMLFEMGQGMRSFGDLATGIVELVSKSFLRMAADVIAQWMMMRFMQPILGGFMPFMPVPTAHQGWKVGESPTGPTRMVPAIAAYTAPRYHQGLRSDERIGVFQTGEEISPRGASRGSMTINLYAIDTQSGVEFLGRHREYLMGLYGDAVVSNNPIVAG